MQDNIDRLCDTLGAMARTYQHTGVPIAPKEWEHEGDIVHAGEVENRGLGFEYDPESKELRIILDGYVVLAVEG